MESEKYTESNPQTSPTWRELSAFINDQAKNDHELIDRWFKRASTLLGIVILVAGTAITWFGYKTLNDARSTAAEAAREAAKAKVEQILQQGEIRELVEKTAQELISRGQFQKATEDAVRSQLPSAVTTELKRQVPAEMTIALARLDLLPRTITPQIAATFQKQIRGYAGKRVAVLYTAWPEPKTFAESVASTLNAEGVIATHQEWLVAETQVIAKDEQFAKLLGDLISKPSGRPTMTLTIGDPRAAVAREEEASGSPFQRGVPDADAYVEISVRLAARTDHQ